MDLELSVGGHHHQSSKIRVRQNRSLVKRIPSVVGAFLLSACFGAKAADALKDAFESPPGSARPRVWWHWMDGNITVEGICEDLKWMQRVGLGGIQTFDGEFNTPPLVPQRLAYMTPPWNEAFRWATKQADELGLELAIASSPGWSESGGPWVNPEDGMKKLVWTETFIQGGAPFEGVVPQPPAVTGPFQDVPIEYGLGKSGGSEPARAVRNYYRDVALIAYRVREEEAPLALFHPTVTSSSGPIDPSILSGARFAKAVHVPNGTPEQPAWIAVDFGHPQRVQSMTVGLQDDWDSVRPHSVAARLERSSDGLHYSFVANAYDSDDFSLVSEPPLEETVTFGPVTARYYRLVLPIPAGRPKVGPMLESFLPPTSTDRRVTRFLLFSSPRVDHFEQKAGYFLDRGLKAHPTPAAAAQDVIDPRSLVDVTALLQPDGKVHWTPPLGRWALLRVGYSLLGITNHPASREATGLEVDKLDRAAVKTYLESYLARYADIVGSAQMGSRGIRAMVNDSYEAGPQNWTPELPREFARRRGYDLYRWLPALTGRVIQSSEVTDRFLWDFRRTLGELIAESHYAQISDTLHARGMIHYGESHENSRAFIGDGMEVKRTNDVPMSAMWAPGTIYMPQSVGDADIRESASVAHLYGQNLVAAESFTAFGEPGRAFAFAPEDLKSTADRELVNGLNLFVIHTSVHQPLTDTAPGATLGPFGQWFTRQETWAHVAEPWVRYLARSSYLLQQGHFVADVLYYYGQDSNITALYRERLPPVPEGYAFDFANDRALTLLTARDRELVTTSGMRYRLLALDPRSVLMSLDVLKTIAKLVQVGASVVGEKPHATPSLADDPEEFRALVDTVWGDGAPGLHRYGAGQVLNTPSLAAALQYLHVAPDFTFENPREDSTVQYVHRHLEDGDVYYLNNRGDRTQTLQARFRVTGFAPELWHADTGLTELVSYRIEGDRTVVPLKLAPGDAIFVVFRKPTRQLERTFAEPSRRSLGAVTGPWEVHFQPGRGAPEHAEFSELRSWTESADPGIRYFSGTATYEVNLDASTSWFSKGQHLEIDLGEVKNLAEVLVNDTPVAILWKSPFRADLTRALHPGVNSLTVRVTNLWVNRLVGDKQPDVTPITSSMWDPYVADSPLLESGLIGPVTIERVTTPTSRTGD